MSVTKEQVVEFIKTMSVIELSVFVKELEEIFGVSAAAPAAAAAPVAAAVVEEKTEFDVMILDGGAEKVKVIKVVREITGLGLKEAKAVVDEAPKAVKTGVNKADAEKFRAALAEAGAKVEVK